MPARSSRERSQSATFIFRGKVEEVRSAQLERNMRSVNRSTAVVFVRLINPMAEDVARSIGWVRRDRLGRASATAWRALPVSRGSVMGPKPDPFYITSTLA